MSNEIGLISVIVPTYNGMPYVVEAIDSILAQAYDPVEVIVVDDGSTDDTASVVQVYGEAVRYYHQPNSGTSTARNQGVRLAHGEWLAFLDADDLWTINKLKMQTDLLHHNPTIDLVSGQVLEFSGATPDQHLQTMAVPGHHPGAMLIKRDAFAEVGSFSEFYLNAEVVEWVARAMRADIQRSMLPDVVMHRRIHDANKGKMSGSATKHEYLHVLKQHLDSKRS
jgi:glycosyltransferase involved in cell wall biosynthesis